MQYRDCHFLELECVGVLKIIQQLMIHTFSVNNGMSLLFVLSKTLSLRRNIMFVPLLFED